MASEKAKALAITGAIAAAVFWVIYAMTQGAREEAQRNSEQAARQLAAQGGATSPVLAAAPPLGWVYSTDTDKMTSKAVKWAELKSTNSLSLQSPYEGKNRGRIYIRQIEGSGPDVMVKIDKGQLMCSGYDGCTLRVRFDQAEPVAFKAIPPTDRSPEMVFLRSERAFIEAARKATRLLVEVEIYRNGAPVLEFDAPQALAWGAAAK